MRRNKAIDRRLAKSFCGAVLSVAALCALFVESLMHALAAAAW
jgi:hypothetical protein